MKTVKPCADQVVDHRIVRRKVEDVVFHDPGRHDQDRLGLHLSVCGAYWISSNRSLRNTTVPGVQASS
jgi:hypothetical protein